MIKVSVIVPVYNTEKYLKKCLDSLVNQTLKEVQVIVINDCSPDDSLNIMREYNKKYHNIEIYSNKKNRGIGYTRNLGISKAKGEYLVFLDSDDFLDLDNLEKMYDTAKENNLDLVVCDLKKVDLKNKILGYEDIGDFPFSNLENNPKLLLDINLGPANKLFSKKLFEDEKVRFSENLKYEDLYVLPLLIANAKKIGRVKNTYYNYLIHQKSETTTMDERVFDILKVLEKVNTDLKKTSYYKNIKDYLEFLNIRTLFRYTLQQVGQKDNNLSEKFVDEAFDFLNKNFSSWKKNKLFSKRNFIKRFIKSNKIITKIYIKIRKKLSK